LEISDRRVVVVDQTMRSMRDAVRMVKLFDQDEHSGRNMFVVNRMGEAGAHALSLKDLHGVLQVKPSALVPFLPNLVTPAAHHGLVAASKGGKFADAVTTLALEISGRAPRRKWWSWRAK
jgi:Flp pilus assembly CpaE family ATPase